jgi:hypothetical protein
MDIPLFQVIEGLYSMMLPKTEGLRVEFFHIGKSIM